MKKIKVGVIAWIMSLDCYILRITKQIKISYNYKIFNLS
jgi:hypothetical protein